MQVFCRGFLLQFHFFCMAWTPRRKRGKGSPYVPQILPRAVSMMPPVFFEALNGGALRPDCDLALKPVSGCMPRAYSARATKRIRNPRRGGLSRVFSGVLRQRNIHSDGIPVRNTTISCARLQSRPRNVKRRLPRAVGSSARSRKSHAAPAAASASCGLRKPAANSPQSAALAAGSGLQPTRTPLAHPFRKAQKLGIPKI